MKVLRRAISHFLPTMPFRYVYMLQSLEYSPRRFISWAGNWPNLFDVMKRGTLVKTKKATALLALARGSYWVGVFFALALAYIFSPLWLISIVLLPILVQTNLVIVVWLGDKAIQYKRRGLADQAKQQLKEAKAVKIAVLGSYGKTTMKELLLTVLSEGKKAKATPGNLNVPISHARWVTSKLEGDEEILIFEYGEGKPGDIEELASLSNPDYAVITGLAPNHLDAYASIDDVAKDLLSISNMVKSEKVFINEDAKMLTKLNPDSPSYGNGGFMGWKVSDVKIGYEGTSFTMIKDQDTLELSSGLLGAHQIGPLVFVAGMAHKLGLSKSQIETGVAKTTSFEHRMQPRQLHGAWIVDDTYNGNLEGIRAGLALMSDLPAKKKVYITPGLVDQGVETESVHHQIGELIASANPDKVVLMQNSVTDFIKSSLENAGYRGELQIETDPLSFYTNLEHLVAAGDLYMLQNDWPDQYK